MSIKKHNRIHHTESFINESSVAINYSKRQCVRCFFITSSIFEPSQVRPLVPWQHRQNVFFRFRTHGEIPTLIRADYTRSVCGRISSIRQIASGLKIRDFRESRPIAKGGPHANFRFPPLATFPDGRQALDVTSVQPIPASPSRPLTPSHPSPPRTSPAWPPRTPSTSPRPPRPSPAP